MQRNRRRADASFSTGSRGGKLKTTTKIVKGKNGGKYRVTEVRRPGKNGRKGRLVSKKKTYVGSS